MLPRHFFSTERAAEMHHLNIDIETFGALDIKKSGLHKYIADSSFEILLISYSYDFGEVVTIDLANGERIPAEFEAWLEDPEVQKHAYNAAFEITALNRLMRTPPEQWLDTMFLGSALGFPLGLKAIGEALDLQADKKDAAGTMLINYFSKVCKPTKANGGRQRNLPRHDPQKWELYKKYNAQDVVAEMAVYRKLAPLLRYIPEDELRRWADDYRLNARGVLADTELCRRIVDMNDRVVYRAEETSKRILKGENPNSTVALLSFFNGKGIRIPNVRAETLAALDRGSLDEEARTLLECRQILAKSSIKKYYAILEAAGNDDRVRGLLQFYGAHTGRWAGRLVQMQNLKRNSIPYLDDARRTSRRGDLELLELMDSPTEIFSQLIRTVFVPSKDKFVVADFSAIEARVLAWLAGEEWVLEAFRNSKDIYCETASAMFGVPVEKHGVNGDLRQKGKIAVLALGYGGGTAALRAMGGDKMGMSDNEMADTVRRWREANPKIKAFWASLDNTAKACIKRPGSVGYCGRLVLRVIRNAEWSFLVVRLPSGRCLFYPQPSIGVNRFGSASITFWTDTLKGWDMEETYGGKLAENITQAVARDCLANAMDSVASMWPEADIVMHIHDELIIDCPAHVRVDEVCDAMAIVPSWAPSLPLEAAGYEGQYYMKD